MQANANTVLLINEAGYEKTITITGIWARFCDVNMRKGIDAFGMEYNEYAAPLIGRWRQDDTASPEIWTVKK